MISLLNDKLSKISKTIELLSKLHKILTRRPLLTIQKSFARLYLHYGDIIYDKAYNTSFYQINYNITLAMTEAIKETFKENIDQGLGLQSLEKKNQWY